MEKLLPWMCTTKRAFPMVAELIDQDWDELTAAKL
jgi:hypothetical protein